MRTSTKIALMYIVPTIFLGIPYALVSAISFEGMFDSPQQKAEKAALIASQRWTLKDNRLPLVVRMLGVGVAVGTVGAVLHFTAASVRERRAAVTNGRRHRIQMRSK